MSSKQIKIDNYFNIMRDDNGRVFGIQEIGDTRDLIKAIEEQNEYIKAKDESYEELRQYHNKCCEDNAKKLEEWLEKYNQVSRDFHNGDFCNTEKCQQLAQLKEENNRLRKRIVTIFDCLIKANRANMIDTTLWTDKITTLWDYIAQTLGIEGDQNQIEEQVEMLYSEGE